MRELRKVRGEENMDMSTTASMITEVSPKIKGQIDADELADFIAHDSGKRKAVIHEVSAVLNRYSIDNILQTPDLVLAEMMVGHMECFGITMVDRQNKAKN